MSYDLMVFEPEAAPRDHYSFLEWCAEQTKWNEEHSYNDPNVTSTRLRAWFLDVIRFFPPLNGVFAEEKLPEDESTAADYSIGKETIYIAFAWSKAELAYRTTLDLAAKHDLGFFNISSQDEEVWLPVEGRLIQGESALRGMEEQHSAGYMERVCRKWKYCINDAVLQSVVIVLMAPPNKKRPRVN